MKLCNIKGCVAINRNDLTHFRVPHRREVREQWIEAIGKHQEFDKTLSEFSVCELHFDTNDIIRYPHVSQLKRGTIPSKFPANFCDMKTVTARAPSNLTISSPRSIKVEKDADLTNAGNIESSSKTSRGSARAPKRTQNNIPQKAVPRKRAAAMPVKENAKSAKPGKSAKDNVASSVGRATSSGRVPKLSKRFQESSYFIKPIKMEKNTDRPPDFNSVSALDSPPPPTPSQSNPPVSKKPQSTVVTKRVTPGFSSTPKPSTANRIPAPFVIVPKISAINSNKSLQGISPIYPVQAKQVVVRGPISKDTVTISKSLFVKLTKTNQELVQANQTISQLRASNQQKDQEIQKLRNFLQTFKQKAQSQSILTTAPSQKRKHAS